MDTSSTIIYKLSREIEHKSGERQIPHEHAAAHHVIHAKAKELMGRAISVLNEHGEKSQEVVSISPFLPITLEKGETVLLGLQGNLNPNGSIESIFCTVTAAEMDMRNMPLFKITDGTLAWWDKRGVTRDDLPFMSAVVGEVYNKAFVPAGE